MRRANDGRTARLQGGPSVVLCGAARSAGDVDCLRTSDVEDLVADLERIDRTADEADLENLGEDLTGLQTVVGLAVDLDVNRLVPVAHRHHPEVIGLRSGRRRGTGGRGTRRRCP